MIKKSGFTLMELLIALALISVLSAIAYPFYNGHLVKVRRTYAAAALEDLAGRMEEYYILNNTYNNATLENLHVNEIHYKSYYYLNIITKDDTYVLRAMPLGKQADVDALCGSLTLDQNGNKNISGNGSVEECWY
jgi:type IV pilus assembly protein PilE